MINLPIDVVPGNVPPVFRWRQLVDTPVGARTVEHEGPLPPSVEVAVKSLIGVAKQLALENKELRRRLEEAQATTLAKKSRGG